MTLQENPEFDPGQQKTETQSKLSQLLPESSELSQIVLHLTDNFRRDPQIYPSDLTSLLLHLPYTSITPYSRPLDNAFCLGEISFDEMQKLSVQFVQYASSINKRPVYPKLSYESQTVLLTALRLPEPGYPATSYELFKALIIQGEEVQTPYKTSLIAAFGDSRFGTFLSSCRLIAQSGPAGSLNPVNGLGEVSRSVSKAIDRYIHTPPTMPGRSLR